MRDIKPRGLILMYYPNGAALEQGPTAVVPGSHSFMPDADLVSALGPMPEPHADRDAWLLKQANSFGDEGREDFRAVVPPGAVLLTDYHIYHRASRNAGPDAPWRPNVKMGAARISEPTATTPRSSWAVASAAQPPLDSTPAVHSAVWSWLAGGPRPADPGAATEQGAALLHDSTSEVQRVEAAHRLAAAAAGGSSAALDSLLDAFAAGSHTSTRAVSYGGAFGDGGDAPHRAAKYGLSAVGPVAAPAVAAALTAAVAAQQWREVPDAAHVLGQCAADDDATAVAALASALAAALSELDEYTEAAIAAGTVEAGYVAPAGNDPKPEGWEAVENDLFTHSRRTAAAELSCALGLVGHRACRAGAVAEALAALDALLLLLTGEGEPGCAFRADGLWNNQLRTTAGTALLRICSDPTRTSASMPLLGGLRGRDRLVKGMVVEAMRRAEASASGGGLASEKVWRRLQEVEWPWAGFGGAEDAQAAVYVPCDDPEAAAAHLQVFQ